MPAIYSNGGNRWNILGFNFTKRDVLSTSIYSLYKISNKKKTLVDTAWDATIDNATT
jgi:hypothetical protein